jgi:hypothetical protein
LKLREAINEEDFFGKNLITYSDKVNHWSGHIQILDFLEYENEQLIYRKCGVKIPNENPIKISDYRHLLEWDALHQTVKLTRLYIKSGQRYSKDSPIVFSLSYNHENPVFNPSNLKPDIQTKEQWIKYIDAIIVDPTINHQVKDLINQR